tara:strand:- start:293 stop:679 length:387 start_codon:yes stop_codon:yes gene_type:complete
MWKEEEYLKRLELQGIDTVCFMGSGYVFEDYRIGQEFYFPFSYYAISADFRRGFTILDSINYAKSYYGRNIFDRYKIIKKYEFKKNKFYGNLRREEKCLIKNTRTKEIIHLKDEDVDRLSWCLMAEPI